MPCRYISPKSVAEGHHQSRGPTPRRKKGYLRSMACGSGAWRQCLVGIKLITDLAQYLTLCRAYNLAEARRLASPVHSPSRAKRRASSRPPRVHVPHCRLATHCETWSERMKHPALRTRRLASHLVETTHGSAELYKPGFSRFNPGKSQYGHIVPAEDRSRGPALTSIGRRSEGAHHQGGAHPGTAEHAGTRRPGGSPRVSLCHRPGEPPRARRPRAADAAWRGRAGASALAVADAGGRAADLLYAPAVTSGGGDSPTTTEGDKNHGTMATHYRLSLYTYCISSNDSARVLSYQELPTSIQCGEAIARRRKENRRAGSASRGMVRRWGRFSSRVRHRVVPDRARVPDRCNASGAAVDVCSDAPVWAQRAERVADGGVVDVSRALSVSPRAPRMHAQRVARCDPYNTHNCLPPKKLRREIQ
jgi:hypothetical protein